MTSRIAADLAVGFDQIDEEHRDLLRQIDECAAAVDRIGVAALRSALAALGDEFVAHFSAEEAMMNETTYPDRGKHKSAHDLFLQDFAQLSQELDTFGVTPLVRQWICSRVPEWTRFHIQVNDTPLGRWLSSRRLRPDATAKREKPRAS